ncbi:uncharacterized protein JN550_006520 [Neoarthrinium moseri]|uniref:uncharacterized protein n=1 Tax=Neoarthrinium moseri TaxID=1658444 RepID=UPI001FDB6F2A|nr:uncharacterized protein JN550_006520 [Neoarthrinium moseri]KAI1868032.1 hypothetical protein JN550_006520 [Neoarthrinium moseri]
MASGRDSQFDTPSWLAFPAPSDTWFGGVAGAGIAQQTVMKAIVRIPRLWRLVHRFRLHPGEKTDRAAAELGAELFKLSLEPWIVKLINSQVLIVSHHEKPNADSEYLRLFSFKIPSVRMLCLLFDYWQSRILICGCLQTLFSLSPNAFTDWPFNITAVQHADVVAASNLMACADEMSALGNIAPIARLRFSPTTMNAFSAWNRLERRARRQVAQSPGEDAEHKRIALAAAQMQRRCCGLMSRWIDFWKPRDDGSELERFHCQMQIHCEFMECGEVPVYLRQVPALRTQDIS